MSRGRIWIGAGIVVAVLVVLGVISVVDRPAAPGPTAAPTASAPADPVVADPVTADPVAAARLAVPRRQPDDPLALGRVDAPVVVAEWGDFQCPFCRLFATNTEPALLTRYVETGRVRLEWHDYAYLGPESVLGARAARAAGRQGKFWPFHDMLYREQPRENSGAVTEASLSAQAQRLGLDVTRFRADLADPAIARAVADDQAAGTRIGVTGVPSFVIAGDGAQRSSTAGTPALIFGAQPTATFEQAIDAALAQAR
jgi:protein-disulfide isomerase